MISYMALIGFVAMLVIAYLTAHNYAAAYLTGSMGQKIFNHVVLFACLLGSFLLGRI